MGGEEGGGGGPPKKQRSLRKKRALEEQEALPEEEGDAGGRTAEDVRALQRQRQRKGGVDAVALALAGASGDEADEPATAAAAANAAAVEGLGAAFKRERAMEGEDDDPHMKKYIEEQLVRRLGRQTSDSGGGEGGAGGVATADGEGGVDANGLPLRQEEGELAPSWVNGIVEVPLSLEAKLKNIEDTEAAKKALLAKGGLALEEEGEGVGPGARRGMYPVHFGRQDPKALERIKDSQERKREQREHHWEKRQQKKGQFKGW